MAQISLSARQDLVVGLHRGARTPASLLEPHRAATLLSTFRGDHGACSGWAARLQKYDAGRGAANFVMMWRRQLSSRSKRLSGFANCPKRRGLRPQPSDTKLLSAVDVGHDFPILMVIRSDRLLAHAHDVPQGCLWRIVGSGVSDDQYQPATEAAAQQAFAQRSNMLRVALTRFFGGRGIAASDIDDMVQDVFLRIVRRGGLSALDNLEAYAFATAQSVLTDRGRRRTTRAVDAHVTFEPDLHGGQDLGPDRIVAGRQALSATTRALM